jgi:ketosteroid isomerase-like protein
VQIEKPELLVEQLDKAFNEGDLEALLAFYEEAAVVVVEPGQTACGAVELRTFFSRILQTGLSARQLKTHILEADGVALFVSRWTLKGDRERQFVATSVFRRQQDGRWKVLIDNPFGPAVLGD